jgi:arginyl-tRNA synthetase
MSAKTKAKTLEYKGHPLRRKDNLIYYGSMADKYIIMLQVTETKQSNELTVPSRITVQLQLTDPNLKSRDRVVKKSEKSSLYEAIDLAAIWLDRALTAA